MRMKRLISCFAAGVIWASGILCGGLPLMAGGRCPEGLDGCGAPMHAGAAAGEDMDLRTDAPDVREWTELQGGLGRQNGSSGLGDGSGLLRLLPCAAAEESAPMQPDTQAALEKELSRLFDSYDTMGACVAVFQNGHVTYTYCYGTRTNGGEAVTPDSLFQCGSISKMAGNIGLMQLVEEQQIPLDTDVGQLLGFPVRHPEYPELPITLRQVMTHTASFNDSSAYSGGLDGDGRTLQQLFSGDWAAASFLPGVKPGTKSVYSNLGGGMIGALVEKLSGETLDSYMQRNVFGPLGIVAAYQPGLLPEDAPVCDLYQMPERQLSKSLRQERAAGGAYTEPDPLHHYYLTAGKLVISAPDLCKLLIVLCDGGACGDAQVLTGGSVREMRTLQNDRYSVSCESGRGLFMNIYENIQVEGRTLYGHGGKAHGMLCAAYFDPADRTGVVMLTNGCNNKPMRNGVGMLGRRVLTAVYEQWLDREHVMVDAFCVE